MGDTPWVADTIDELLAGAEARTEVRTSDAKSGASFERLLIDGRPHFLKVLSAEADWIMRVTGNTTHWELQAWKAGLYAAAPAVIDHAMVGMAIEGTGPEARLAMLMCDRSADLVPEGDAPLPIDQHERFIDHLAAFHTANLGWIDTLGLQQLARRFLFFAPATIEPEIDAADAAGRPTPGPIAVAADGWQLLPCRAPRLDALVRLVHAQPDVIVDALAGTPHTFVAGDWKLGNLGSRTDGRTVVLDWAYPGEAPPCWELAWYLALNRSRLPQSKEATIAAYRNALEQHGLDTTDWFERQLGLCLVGIMATFAWEKAVGDEHELRWWETAVLAGASYLD
jgi:hypothetical protein